MKIRTIGINGLMVSGLLLSMLTSCTRPVESDRDADDRGNEAARQAGRAAYAASQKAKEAAKQAERAAEELNRKMEKDGQEARKGWDQAKRENEAKRTSQ